MDIDLHWVDFKGLMLATSVATLVSVPNLLAGPSSLASKHKTYGEIDWAKKIWKRGNGFQAGIKWVGHLLGNSTASLIEVSGVIKWFDVSKGYRISRSG